MLKGVVVQSTPQGGPLSPLLANIYLDALDEELERRGQRFSRYADDCNIYVGSQAAAERVLESVTGMDREASATEGECQPKAGQEGPGNASSWGFG